MVNRFIAIIAMNLSIVRGPRPFLIGFHPLGVDFLKRFDFEGTPSGELLESAVVNVSPVGFLHCFHVSRLRYRG